MVQSGAIEIRADADFAIPALYDYCEAEVITYTIALITNEHLKEMGERHCSKKPVKSTKGRCRRLDVCCMD